MKRFPIFPILITAALAGTAGWLAATRLPASRISSPVSTPARSSSDRKVLYYQSAMHPWIRSDRPGKCTICGMELTPVLEGDPGFTVEPGMVTLSSNSLAVLGVASTGIRTGPLVRTLRVAGLLDEDDTRHRIISAYVGGRIEALHVDHIGAEVTAGQPLATLYSPMLIEAERQFIALAKTHSNESTNLAGDHFLLRESAAQRLRQLGLTQAQIEELPDKAATNQYSEILAPISGTVVTRSVYSGQYVMEGEKLFEIADFSTLWFRFDAYEQDLPWLTIGQEMEITTPAAPGRTIKAPIRFIEPSLTEMTRSAKIRVVITNPVVAAAPDHATQRLLRHRLYAEGRVRIVSTDVTLVPRSAVLSPAGDPVVYIDRTGGAYELRHVQLGRLGDTEYEVITGLKPGDQVVTSGNLMIDAQAQLNEVIMSGEKGHDNSKGSTSAPARLPLLPPDQTQAASTFLTLADTLRAKLSSDDLAGYNAAATQLHAAAEAMMLAFNSTTQSQWTPVVQAVANRAHLEPGTNLRAARKGYHPLSVALVDLARHLRAEGDPEKFKGLHVFQCPMTAEAFDAAPPRAQWFQLGLPLRNPWFGKEMLECGVEVAN